MERGYLKLWRKSIDSDVFQNPGLWRVWTWCLMKSGWEKRSVPFKTGKGKLAVTLNPGQFLFGRHSAAEALGDSPSTVWKRIKKLEAVGCISIQSNRQYSIVSICNWSDYQQEDIEKEQASDKQVTSKEQASDKQVTSKEHKEEVKEVKEIEEVTIKEKILKRKFDVFSFRPNHISEQEWSDLVNHRRSVKATESERAYSAVVNQLNIAITKGHTVCECIDEICNRSWKGFKASWMDNSNGNGKPQTQKERHNDIREQYARDLLTKKFGNNLTSNGSYEKLGN